MTVRTLLGIILVRTQPKWMEHADGYTCITVVKYHILFIPPSANIWNDSDAGTRTKIHLCYQIMWVVAWNLLF